MKRTRTSLRIGLVGGGYWGKNLLRNLLAKADCEVVGVVDSDPAVCERLAGLHPHVRFYRELEVFLRTERPDGVVIATPPETHRDIAVASLRAGAGVLIEKPFAHTVEAAREILAVAQQKQRLVMVDHTFLFNPAVEYLLKAHRAGQLGELLHYDSVRTNFGGFQKGTNALWDLAPHDLSILDALTGGRAPLWVQSMGVRHQGSPVENVVYVHLEYPKQLVAHLHLNWTAPLKTRCVTLTGTQKMVVYDENQPTERVRIYNQRVSLTHGQKPQDFRVSYRVGDLLAPALSSEEPLFRLLSTFARRLRQQKLQPLRADGTSGLRVVKILEAAEESLAQNGVRISLERKAKLKRAA